jgi:hypothetical protein
MKKPVGIYEMKWYILVSYGDFDIRENPYHIPTPFFNLGVDTFDPEEEPKKLLDAIYEVFDEYANDSWENQEDFEKWIKSKPKYLYYCQLPDSDILADLQDLLDRLLEPKSTMDMGEYHTLVNYLPKMIEVKIALRGL